jgi:hypothetical protein
VAFGLLFAVSRNNHPTATINACASLLFVLFSAGAAYLNLYCLFPALWARKRWAAYCATLVAAIGLYSLLVVISIRGIYSLLWFDDPRMFGFWTNMGLDSIIVTVLVVGATGVRWAAGRLRDLIDGTRPTTL